MHAPSRRPSVDLLGARPLLHPTASLFTILVTSLLLAACGEPTAPLAGSPCGDPPLETYFEPSDGGNNNTSISYTFTIVSTFPNSAVDAAAQSIGTGSGGGAEYVEARDLFCFVPDDAARLGQGATAQFTILGRIEAEASGAGSGAEASVWFSVGGESVGHLTDDTASTPPEYATTLAVPVTLGTWVTMVYEIDARVYVGEGGSSRAKAILNVHLGDVTSGPDTIALHTVETASGTIY